MRHSDAPPTSAAAANVPLPPAANASAHLRSKYSATHISKLKDLGYKEADVLNALEASGGNLNQVSYFVWVMLIIDSAFLIIFQLELEPHFRFECLFYSISLVFHSDPTCQSAEWLLANAQYQAAGQTPSDQAEAGTSSANATPAETASGASRWALLTLKEEKHCRALISWLWNLGDCVRNILHQFYSLTLF